MGSIKGNIGHAENASGLASIAKSILMLNRLKIPPVGGCSTPKPGLPLDRMHIPTKLLSWPNVEEIMPRISVNSFGFGGANAHAILEMPSQPAGPLVALPDGLARLFCFSANSQKSLLSMIDAYRRWLEDRPGTSLVDLSYTLCYRRTALPWRFSCVAEDHVSLLHGLEQGLSVPRGQPSPLDGYVAFVFTGQGAQWAGMGRELLIESSMLSSVFRDSIRASSAILYELGAAWNLEAELLRDAAEPSLLNTMR